DGDAGGRHLAHRGVEGVVVGRAAVAVVGALTAEAHVDDLDVVGGGVLRHPVQAADDAGDVARPVGAEDPNGVERRAGRHADDTGDPLVGHDTGHVGAVPVVVGRDGIAAAAAVAVTPAEQAAEEAGRRRSAVVAAGHVEVGPVHDAGVEQGDGRLLGG